MMNKNNKSFIKTKNLYSEIDFQDSTIYVMNDANIDIPKGSSIGIVGESGSGKTQLILSICGMQDTYPGPVEGSVRYYMEEAIDVYDYKKSWPLRG